MKRVALAALLLVGLMACGGNDKPDPSDEGHSLGTNAQGNTTTTEFGQRPSDNSGATTRTTVLTFNSSAVSTPDTSPPATLVAVSIGEHDGFVRVVFEFEDSLPGYAVKHADPPFVQDGSGEEVEVLGDGHIAVRLTAQAHDNKGQPTLEQSVIPGPKGSSVVGVRMIGDFEGVVNFVIGTTTTKPFKVFTLKNLPRVVVDIQSP